MTFMEYVVWVGVVGMFLIGDLATTWLFIASGLGEEGNPFVLYVLYALGRFWGWSWVVVMKLILTVWAMASYTAAVNIWHKIPALVLTVMGFWVVGHNIRVGIHEIRHRRVA